ncbi:uncharacterized protein KGF55_004669 [Candida pseudojiufengensis]|uniref:uncharacterized protein n=1 Tax=Candida pseudojiufengensis TaxID=497109 RepID=UPI002224AC4F|nr:uncharacterized protein KGF55_004669 [Candida pseudojiufengensis]KAI5960377.1 hypothetical protein KGF55_004669 [Candida pseudojiufengensis]
MKNKKRTEPATGQKIILAVHTVSSTVRFAQLNPKRSNQPPRGVIKPFGPTGESKPTNTNLTSEESGTKDKGKKVKFYSRDSKVKVGKLPTGPKIKVAIHDEGIYLTQLSTDLWQTQISEGGVFWLIVVK